VVARWCRKTGIGYQVQDFTDFDKDRGGEWPSVARELGLMSDVRGGVPRSGYSGIVQLRAPSGARVYAAPRQLCAPPPIEEHG
jgi:hypothetical protein